MGETNITINFDAAKLDALELVQRLSAEGKSTTDNRLAGREAEKAASKRHDRAGKTNTKSTFLTSLYGGSFPLCAV